MIHRNIFLLAGLVMITCACSDLSEQQIIQGDNHWVELDVADAREDNGKLLWDFTIKRQGSYNVQVISNG